MPSSFELNPTFSFTLLGSFVIHMWNRPSRTICIAVLVGAIGLRVACVRLMGGLGSYYGVWWISWGAFLGLSSLVILTTQFFLSGNSQRRGERELYRQTFYSGAVFPLCSLLIGYVLPVVTWLRPKTYDAFLLAADGSLGMQPSFIFARLIYGDVNGWGLSTIVYYALPLVICILYASHLAAAREGKPEPVMILGLLLSLMVVGITQYWVYPAVGPQHAFPELYPRHTPLLSQIALEPMTVPDAPRNCMPSLHLAGALVIWWNSRIWPRWGRCLAFLFLCMTIFSTLALGEHYLVDLVVAAPFTLIFQAAWMTPILSARVMRRRSLIVGALLTVAWLALLRCGVRMLLVSSVIPWTLTLLTVAWCCLLQRRLRNAAQA